MASRPLPWLPSILLVLACSGDDVPGGSSGGSGSSSTGTTTGSTTPAEESSTGRGETTTGAVVDGSSGETTVSTDSAPPTTTGVESSGSDDEGTTTTDAPVPANGCADGVREVLLDEMLYPDIAACGGAWSIPGVLVNNPMCMRQGGNNGAIPTGRGCSVEDLCGEDWHVCESREEVMAAGIEDCNGIAWGARFFVTRQSGEGGNACNPIGLNDVFGCGTIGFAEIEGCAPLNRSGANLCAGLPEPWSCGPSSSEEAEFIVKAGPEFGGALCCRD